MIAIKNLIKMKCFVMHQRGVSAILVLTLISFVAVASYLTDVREESPKVSRRARGRSLLSTVTVVVNDNATYTYSTEEAEVSDCCFTQVFSSIWRTSANKSMT